ncbi:MAG: GtrA family protein [Bacteroidales bacterium]|nr:GtrA family protein [Bacteroidales bacterium]
MRKERLYELIRFGIVGGTSALLHYGIYLFLNIYLAVNIAYSIGYIISFVMNFFLSNYFTFRTRPSLKKGIGFGASHLINYLLQISFLNIILYFGIPETYAPILVFIIVVPINFLLVRTVLKSSKF